MPYVLLLLMAAIAPAQATAPSDHRIDSSASPATKLELNEPEAFNFAGVKISMPKGFEVQPPGGANAIVRAVKIKSEQPTMSVSLSAYALRPDVTLDDFVKNTQPGRDDLSVRAYRQLGTSSINVAGLAAKAMLVSYEYRSVPTKSLMVYFLRSLESEGRKLQLGYLLAGEGDKENFPTVYGATCDIASRLQLIDVVHPGQQPLGDLTLPIESRANGYSIKLPEAWKFQINRERSQIQLYQIDFLQGGQPMPNMKFAVQPEINAAQVAATVIIRNIEDSLTKGNIEYKVEHEGPGKMAGVDAYEFLIKQSIRERDSQVVRESMLMVRLACLNGRSYMLALNNDGSDAGWMTATMDKIASTLELTAPVTSMPTSLPGGPEATSKPSGETAARSEALPASSEPSKEPATEPTADDSAASKPSTDGADK